MATAGGVDEFYWDEPNVKIENPLPINTNYSVAQSNSSDNLSSQVGYTYPKNENWRSQRSNIYSSNNDDSYDSQRRFNSSRPNDYQNRRYSNDTDQRRYRSDTPNYNRGRGNRTTPNRGYQNWHSTSSNFIDREKDSSVSSEAPKVTEDAKEPFKLIDWDSWREGENKRIEEEFGHLPPIVKVTYEEAATVRKMTLKQVETLRKQKNSISVTKMDGSPAHDAPKLVTTFEEAFGKYKEIMRMLREAEFKEPTPIQCQLWPIIMSGHDVIGIAQTGSGKTLAYLLPAFLHITSQEYFRLPERYGPLCLVIAPTRELAQQIEVECNKFKYHGIKSVCIYGQGSYQKQCKAIENGVEIVVCTPGRLGDFIGKGILDMRGVSYLVLDEADRMLDMGFLPDISKIVSGLRPHKQVVLTSATWASDVEYIAKRLFSDSAMKVIIGDLDLATVSTVTQHIEVCEEEEKFDKATELLKDLAPDDKVLIFTNRKVSVDVFTLHLLEHGVDSRIMHGGLEQSDREQSLQDLKEGIAQILIATDVASRGLDILDLTLVINIDLPKNLEEYVHRCGRTGRAGKSGEVMTFVTWQDRPKAQELIDILRRTNQEVPDSLERLAARHRLQQERFPKPNRGRREYNEHKKWF